MRYAGDGGRRPHGFEGDDDAGGEQPQGVFTYDSKLQDHQAVVFMAPATELIRVRTVDGLPRAVTVCFATPQQVMANVMGIGATLTQAELVGELQMGIGGNTYYAEIDLARGAQFTLAVSSLSVRARYSQFLGAVPVVGTVVPLDVGAAVAQGVISSNYPPQRTLGNELATVIPAAGGALAFPWTMIPTFSRTLRVSGRELFNLAFPRLVVLFGAPGQIIEHNAVVAMPGEEIAIPPDAVSVAVQVSGDPGTGIDNLRLIFDLLL